MSIINKALVDIGDEEYKPVQVNFGITHPYNLTVFDISHFSSYNELHGKEKSDELLKKIVEIVNTFLSEQDVICRCYADNFIVLSCKNNLNDLIHDIKVANSFFNELLDSRMLFDFGI